MARLSVDDCAAARAPGRVIRRIDKLMAPWIESRMPPGEMNFSQWVALKLVDDGIATNPGAIARELGHSTGAVTRLIDGLEQRGLIARDRDGGDRRVVTLRITEPGREQLRDAALMVRDSWNEVLEDFNQEEADRLFAGLDKLLAAVERKTREAQREDIAA